MQDRCYKELMDGTHQVMGHLEGRVGKCVLVARAVPSLGLVVPAHSAGQVSA